MQLANMEILKLPSSFNHIYSYSKTPTMQMRDCMVGVFLIQPCSFGKFTTALMLQLSVTARSLLVTAWKPFLKRICAQGQVNLDPLDGIRDKKDSGDV